MVRGQWGNLGLFSDHKESGPWFNVLPKDDAFRQYSVPVTILGR